MKKVLILGAKGNLGIQLVKVFKKDYRVLAWDRENLDFLDFKKLAEKIKTEKPEIIINAVAYNNVDACEEDDKELDLAYKLNRDLPKNLAQIAVKLNSRLVHFSTNYVFGGEVDRKFYDEKDSPSPLQKYGETKYAGEKEIARIKLKNEKFEYFLIRTSKLFGPKGKSEFAKPNFFDVMLNLAKTKNQLDVVDEEWSCFTYIPDLAQVTKIILEENYGFGIYHIVNEGAVSWFESVIELFKIQNVKIKVNPVSGDKFPRPAKRPISSILQNTRFPKLRNYTEALTEYLVTCSKSYRNL